MKLVVHWQVGHGKSMDKASITINCIWVFLFQMFYSLMDLFQKGCISHIASENMSKIV